MRILLVLAFLGLFSTPILAQEKGLISGNDVYSFCANDAPMVQQGFCAGYVIGLLEGARFGLGKALFHLGEREVGEVNSTTETLLGFCLPVEANYEQHRDVIYQYLKNNPDTRHESARSLGFLALSESFPCQE
jgi:hypothetical protein